MIDTSGGDLPAPQVTVRYWAGAAAAAGVESEVLTAATVGDALDLAVAAHPGLARVIPVCSCLVGGVRATLETPLADGVTLEILPPFAGG